MSLYGHRVAILSDCYHSGFIRRVGIDKNPITPEEARARNDRLATFDLYASDGVREKILPIARIFGNDMPENDDERKVLLKEFNSHYLALEAEIKKDLKLS